MLMASLGYSLCIFSLYCMAGGFVATAFGARQEIFLPLFFVCVACNVLGTALNKLPKGVRALCALPILALAFMCRSIPEYALLFIPFVIVVTIQLTGKYVQDHYDFKQLFFKLLIAVVICLLLLLFFEYMGDLGVYFTLIYVVSGILTLRLLRQDAEVSSSTKFVLANSLPLLIFTALITVLGNTHLLGSALSGIGWLFKMLGRGILLLFGGIGYLFMLLFKKEELAMELSQEEAEATEAAEEGIKRIPWKFTFGTSRDNTALMIALIAIILFIIAVIVVISILTHNRRTRPAGSGSSLEKRTRYRGGLGSGTGSTVHSAVTRGSAGIRALYKKWLKLLKKRRVVVTKSDTTLDVLERRAPACVPYEAHKTLRGLYVRARYDEGYSPTKEEQHAAKAAYEELSSAEFNMLNEPHWND